MWLFSNPTSQNPHTVRSTLQIQPCIMNNQWDNQNSGSNLDGQGGQFGGANSGRGQYDNQPQGGQFGGQGGQLDSQTGSNQFGGAGDTDSSAWDNSQGQGGFGGQGGLGGQGRQQRSDDFGGQGGGFDSNSTSQGQGGYQNQSSAGVGGNQSDSGYGGGNNPDDSRYAAEGAYGDQSNTGKKPGFGDKLMGGLEKVAGKTTRNPGMVERGEDRKTGENY